MKFKLPQLDKFVNSDKNIADEEENKLIHVVSGIAYVYNNIFVAVDLREYIKKECSIDSPEEFQELDSILGYLDGSSFTKAYWNELVKENTVSLTPDGLEITNDHYTKLLLYTEVISVNTKMGDAKNHIDRSIDKVDKVAFYGKDIINVIDAFKKEMKSDSFIFAFTGKENVIKFVGNSKNYIFGYIPTNFDASQEMFDNFDCFKDFSEILFDEL